MTQHAGGFFTAEDLLPAPDITTLRGRQQSIHVGILSRGVRVEQSQQRLTLLLDRPRILGQEGLESTGPDPGKTDRRLQRRHQAESESLRGVALKRGQNFRRLKGANGLQRISEGKLLGGGERRPREHRGGRAADQHGLRTLKVLAEKIEETGFNH